ncbi:hypothetical protein GCM10009760_35470 [Kitasatospora kazusensis]|uniref:Uncharacterized protein n=1 Tax=Kitasatospora kazusensis TaxID=407974 RepID=A0ABN2ZR19_9ACTN
MGGTGRGGAVRRWGWLPRVCAADASWWTDGPEHGPPRAELGVAVGDRVAKGAQAAWKEL